jgi:PAS domain S-box-containing protein
MADDTTQAITQQHLRRILRHDEDQLPSLILHDADGLFIVDRADVICFANAATSQLLTRPSAELVGWPFGYPIVPGAATEIDIVRAGQPPRRAMETVWANQPAFMVTLHDITEHQLAEEKIEQLQRNNAMLAEINAAITRENAERAAAHQQKQTALYESEDKFTRVFRVIPELILINRIADGLILEVNDAAQQFRGYSRPALIGRSLSDVRLWNEPAEYRIFLDRLLEKGCYHNLATAFRTATGETVPVLVSGCLVEMEGQSCIVSISRDTTEHRRMQEALRAGRECYCTLVENMPIAVHRTTPGPRGSFLMVNPAFCAMLGYTTQELRQTAVTDIYHALSERRQFSDRVLQESRVTNVELRLRRKDGTLYDAALIVAPLSVTASQLGGFVAIARDITRQKELDRLKDQFVANVSHELRTPLTNIKLYVTLLQQRLSDKHPQYWLTLQREVNRLEGLIESLLSISRLDMGQAPLELEALDMNDVVRQLLRDRVALIGERGLTVETVLAADLPPARASANFVSQFLSNLVTNATHYTPPSGQIVVSTARRSDRDRSWITFTVKDTGSGINADDLPRLFERFYRGEAGRRSGTPGIGLGLATCSDVADKLGGHITVAGPPGQGAAFTVWLKPMEEQP